MANKEYNQSIGRRKQSSVSMKLFGNGSGSFMIKTPKGIEKSLQEYFGGNVYLYENAISPLIVLGNDLIKKFDAQISIRGGGIAGHSDAVKLAFSRALIEWNPELRITLKPYGLLKRDPRVKERKKPGLKKARKSPTRSKR